MTRMIVYSANDDLTEYDEVATIHDDATVDGTAALADHFREIIQDMKDKGYTASDFMAGVFEVVEIRYNNGYYRASRIE